MVLTPEEWVRQHVLSFLMRQKQTPRVCIGVEKEVRGGSGPPGRFDVAVWHPARGQMLLLVECKAPQTSINKDMALQIARYNARMHALALWLTNGYDHRMLIWSTGAGRYDAVNELPDYITLKKMSEAGFDSR
mgnify:FL=1